jgi:hypothetical protein
MSPTATWSRLAIRGRPRDQWGPRCAKTATQAEGPFGGQSTAVTGCLSGVGPVVPGGFGRCWPSPSVAPPSLTRSSVRASAPLTVTLTAFPSLPSPRPAGHSPFRRIVRLSPLVTPQKTTREDKIRQSITMSQENTKNRMVKRGKAAIHHVHVSHDGGLGTRSTVLEKRAASEWLHISMADHRREECGHCGRSRQRTLQTMRCGAGLLRICFRERA